ncbi:hypothetical protein [Pseudomonas sp. NPDC087626]|uniref:hypothetical protein n=1 Tax=Pseudomonas sp. NPDC087626 TaxID=3364444 RepID=UPI0037F629CF
MTLGLDEIKPGAVAILDSAALFSDPEITTTEGPQSGMRPFVCVRVEGEDSIWLKITTQWSKPRLCLNAWKVPGSDTWMHDNQYLQDARKHFSGPNSSFITASANELLHQPHDRPSIGEEGVQAISDEIRKYKAPWF